MSCTRIDSQLAAWRDGTLPEAEARALEAHAAGCAPCGARLDAASRLAPLPADLPPPPALREATLAAVARRRRRTPWFRTAVIAAGLTAAAVLATMVRPPVKHSRGIPGGAAALLAAQRATPALRTLDEVEHELTAALRRVPDDPDLRARLQNVLYHREALRTLIEDAPK